jgi:hypothetical protein
VIFVFKALRDTICFTYLDYHLIHVTVFRDLTVCGLMNDVQNCQVTLSKLTQFHTTDGRVHNNKCENNFLTLI